MIAALAIDLSQLVAARAQLQATADAAAHAAIHARAEGDSSAAAARARALDVAEAGMPPDRYGMTVRANNGPRSSSARSAARRTATA